MTDPLSHASNTYTSQNINHVKQQNHSNVSNVMFTMSTTPTPCSPLLYGGGVAYSMVLGRERR